MSFIGSDITTMAARLLLDISDEAYLADMLTYLNEGQRRFAVETHVCQATVDLTISANTIAFTTIADAVSNVNEVILVPKVMLKATTNPLFLDKAELWEMKSLPLATVIVPTRFWIFGKKVFFDLHHDALPSSTSTIYFTYIPDDLSALTETVLIPDQWIMALVHYIAYCVRVSDRDAGLANGEFSDYQNIKNQAAAITLAQAGSY